MDDSDKAFEMMWALPADSDYKKFIGFFQGMGVEMSSWPRADMKAQGDEPKLYRYAISVSQAHFMFDKDGRYLGVLADEMGHFDKRKKI